MTKRWMLMLLLAGCGAAGSLPAPSDASCADGGSCPAGTRWNAFQCACVVPSGKRGDPCGGNIINPPPPCQSGLVCQNKSGLPAGDVGGVCEPL